ncbi:caspase domain-containing protein [Armillaria borealis]|uniref:Caspase domain-containing protein n=1 Tax=Armillaria borealis TaxID=47425 RepID=A0AA39MSV4_9AGAR|nr:caspase domain-containing protein [Armillaria borealis]
MGQVLSVFGWFLSVVFKNLSNVVIGSPGFSVEEGQAKRALADRGAPVPQTRQAFALVIGIDKYKFVSPNQDLHGAVKDADNFKNYLISDRGVPEANIINLRNEEATRYAIIEGFRKLQDDSRIIPGEGAIIIYFAGHGAGKGKVEGIPDRTLSRLILDLSNAKGNNITLILDCCHAAGMNRGSSLRSRALNLKSVQDLSPTCDEHIYSQGSRTRSVQDGKSGFSASYFPSHVLLAACKRTQTAWEDGNNGIFTAALLKSLRNVASSDLPPTYDSLMKSLPLMRDNQTPHWDGNVHRLIFESWQDPAGSCMIPCSRGEVGSPWPSDLVLHAGSLHGITVDSTFEIFRSASRYPNAKYLLATLKVKEVKKSISCFTPFDTAVFASQSEPNLLWFARLRKAASVKLSIYCNDPDVRCRILADDFESRLMVDVIDAENAHAADLCLTVEEQNVRFSQGKSASGKIPRLSSQDPTQSPFTIHSLAEIRAFINRYALFTPRLNVKSPGPIEKFVHIEMNKLVQDDDCCWKSKCEVVPENSELAEFAVDISRSKKFSDPYGFTVHNKCGADLYTYLLYFDASTCEIGTFCTTRCLLKLTSFGIQTVAWYSSQQGPAKEAVDACLVKDSKLTLGHGRSGMAPIIFKIPDGQDVDICYIKILVTTKAVDIQPIVQYYRAPPDVKPRGAMLMPNHLVNGSDVKWASKTMTIKLKYAQSAKEDTLAKFS